MPSAEWGPLRVEDRKAWINRNRTLNPHSAGRTGGSTDNQNGVAHSENGTGGRYENGTEVRYEKITGVRYEIRSPEAADCQYSQTGKGQCMMTIVEEDDTE